MIILTGIVFMWLWLGDERSHPLITLTAFCAWVGSMGLNTTP